MGIIKWLKQKLHHKMHQKHDNFSKMNSNRIAEEMYAERQRIQNNIAYEEYFVENKSENARKGPPIPPEPEFHDGVWF